MSRKPFNPLGVAENSRFGYCRARGACGNFRGLRFLQLFLVKNVLKVVKTPFFEKHVGNPLPTWATTKKFNVGGHAYSCAGDQFDVDLYPEISVIDNKHTKNTWFLPASLITKRCFSGVKTPCH